MEYNIKGEIGLWGLPLCKIIVVSPEDESQFLEVTGVIDTGAYDYFITQKVIDLLKLPKVGEGKVDHAIAGTKDSCIYKADFVFNKELRLNSFLCKVLIMESYPAEVILGTSFLEGKSFYYNNLTGTWRVVW